MAIIKYFLILFQKAYYSAHIVKLFFCNFKGKNILKEADLFEGYVNLSNEDANSYIRECLKTNKPLMISKFGTIELNNLIQYISIHQSSYSFNDIIDFIKGERKTLWWAVDIHDLCRNAGFFPDDFALLGEFYKVYLPSITNIDILGSYQRSEKIFFKELSNAKKISLDPFYSPYFFDNPWTLSLKGKKVLVIHPFNKEIEFQYSRINLVWNKFIVLPEFELKTYKPVQSMLGLETEYNNWFEALEMMKNDIARIEFDVAIIGCGAYGMPLASHIKNLGKQAIHLAGWTQVLFGIIGERWLNNPRISPLINENWIHPFKENIPQNSKIIENGAYW